MAGFRPAAVLFCACAVAVLACSLPAARAEAPTDSPFAAYEKSLTAPLGSGQNKPVSLGLAPTRGRKFGKLMRLFVEAARSGDMAKAQQLQQQLFAHTKSKPLRRRHLLQASETCPALMATTAAPVKAAPTPVPATGPAASTPGTLPAIRYATLEPCAEWACRTNFTLTRQQDGSIVCKGPEGVQLRSVTAAAAAAAADATAAAAAPLPEGDGATLRQPVTLRRVLPFEYFQVYDYNFFWNTDDDNVLGALYAGNVLQNANQITSSRGALGLSSRLGSNTQVRVEPNPFIGIRADQDVAGELNAGLQVSQEVGDNAVIGIKTATPSITTAGTYAAVLPGTTQADRNSGPASDDNVVFPTNNAALFGYFGKKKH